MCVEPEQGLDLHADNSTIQALLGTLPDLDWGEQQQKCLFQAAQLYIDASSIMSSNASANRSSSSAMANLRDMVKGVIGEIERLKQQPKPVPARRPIEKQRFDDGVVTPWNNFLNIHLNSGSQPTSSRMIPVKEQKLILLSSQFNGETFKQWTQRFTPTPEMFSAQTTGKFIEPNDMSLSSSQQKHFKAWLSPTQALPPPSWTAEVPKIQPVMKQTEPTDLVQDLGSDCSVVASFCAEQARTERGFDPVLIKTLYPQDDQTGLPRFSSNKKYVCKFNFNGSWRGVEIDDRLPVSDTKRVIHVINRNNPSLLWPILLEKAYLKVRGGYDFPGSNSNTDLWVMIGWIPEQVFLREHETDGLWDRMCYGTREGNVLITLGTGSMSSHAEKELGLASNHDYAVLDLKVENEQEMVLVKNPWCDEVLFRPLVSIDEPKSSRMSIAMPTKEPMAPGTFWISLQDVLQHFDSIYLNWNPGIFRSKEEIHFEWDLRRRSTMGTGLIDNPQFAMKAESSGTVWLLLTRHFQSAAVSQGNLSDDGGVGLLDMDDNLTSEKSSETIQKHSGHIALYAFDKGGAKVYMNDGAVDRSHYVDSPQVLLKLEAKAKTIYTVVASEQELPRSCHKFTLTVFSDCPVEIEYAEERYKYSISEASKWTIATAGGSNPSAPEFSSNPQFVLELPQPTAIVMLLETTSPGLHVNVKLCHGRGRRIHQLKSQDILVHSGQYRSNVAIAERSPQQIAAGVYTIIVSTYEAGQLGTFKLRVDTMKRASLRLMPSEQAGKFVDKLPKAIFSGTVSTLLMPLFPSCLVKVSVVVRFASSFHSRQNTSGTRSPIQIRIKHVTGHMEHELATSGAFSDETGAGVRLNDFDLDPSMLKGELFDQSLFLVLERLGGGVVGSEERYFVELLHEGGMGRGLQRGEWRSYN